MTDLTIHMLAARAREMQDNERVADALRNVLILDTTADWSKLRIILAARLSVADRACLGLAALLSLPRDEAWHVADIALDRGAGPPIPPLVDWTDEAAFWADLAEPAEREAYCLAGFRAMARHRQLAFLDYVGRKAA